MAYILDTQKNDTGEYVIPIGTFPTATVTSFNPTFINNLLSVGSSQSTKYTFPADRTLTPLTILEDEKANGIVEWKTIDDINDKDYSITTITAPITSYNILPTDDLIDIISDTVIAVNLPLITLANAGKKFIINRSSHNDALYVYPATGNQIVGEPDYWFRRIHTRIHVISNGRHTWYIL